MTKTEWNEPVDVALKVLHYALDGQQTVART